MVIRHVPRGKIERAWFIRHVPRAYAGNLNAHGARDLRFYDEKAEEESQPSAAVNYVAWRRSSFITIILLLFVSLVTGIVVPSTDSTGAGDQSACSPAPDRQSTVDVVGFLDRLEAVSFEQCARVCDEQLGYLEDGVGRECMDAADAAAFEVETALLAANASADVARNSSAYTRSSLLARCSRSISELADRVAPSRETAAEALDALGWAGENVLSATGWEVGSAVRNECVAACGAQTRRIRDSLCSASASAGTQARQEELLGSINAAQSQLASDLLDSVVSSFSSQALDALCGRVDLYLESVQTQCHVWALSTGMQGIPILGQLVAMVCYVLAYTVTLRRCCGCCGCRCCGCRTRPADAADGSSRPAAAGGASGEDGSADARTAGFVGPAQDGIARAFLESQRRARIGFFFNILPPIVVTCVPWYATFDMDRLISADVGASPTKPALVAAARAQVSLLVYAKVAPVLLSIAPALVRALSLWKSLVPESSIWGFMMQFIPMIIFFLSFGTFLLPLHLVGDWWFAGFALGMSCATAGYAIAGSRVKRRNELDFSGAMPAIKKAQVSKMVITAFAVACLAIWAWRLAVRRALSAYAGLSEAQRAEIEEEVDRRVEIELLAYARANWGLAVQFVLNMQIQFLMNVLAVTDALCHLIVHLYEVDGCYVEGGGTVGATPPDPQQLEDTAIESIVELVATRRDELDRRKSARREALRQRMIIPSFKQA